MGLDGFTHCSELFPSATVREFITSAKPFWGAGNWSLALGPDGYRANLRSSNFLLHDNEAMEYRISTQTDGIIRTHNFLAILDDNLNPLTIEPLDESAVRGPVQYPEVQNVEDIRYFWHEDEKCWYSYGTIRSHRKSGIAKICQDRLEGPKSVERVIFEGPHPDRYEKNWTCLGGTGDYVYLFDPASVWTSGRRLKHSPTRTETLAGRFRELRGGSQAIPTEDGYICVVHELFGPGRRYLHRFIALDDEGYMTGYTEPFYFKQPWIEFALGLVEHNDDYVISFGFRETRALLARAPITEVHSQIKDV